MIEKTCKIELKDIDFLVLECGSCGSEIRATKAQNFPTSCPICRAHYGDYAVYAMQNILNECEILKKNKPKSKIYVLTKEDVK